MRKVLTYYLIIENDCNHRNILFWFLYSIPDANANDISTYRCRLLVVAADAIEEIGWEVMGLLRNPLRHIQQGCQHNHPLPSGMHYPTNKLLFCFGEKGTL
jgi:hypothetical protein